MNSILANVFLKIQERLKSEVPALKWIDQDFGQLEFYSQKPAVNFPCALIDIDDTPYSNNGELSQLGEPNIIIRLAFPAYTPSNQLAPTPEIKKALEYYNLEHEVNKALHGYASEYFGTLTRVHGGKEKRDDNIRVRVLRYNCAFIDNTACEVLVKPDEDIELEIDTAFNSL